MTTKLKPAVELVRKRRTGALSLFIMFSTALVLTVVINANPDVNVFTHAGSNVRTVMIDNVSVQVKSPFIKDINFIAPDPNSAIQEASAVNWHPYEEISITSAPLGLDASTESVSNASSTAQYQSAVLDARQREGAAIYDGPVAQIFGVSVPSKISVVKINTNSVFSQKTAIAEWITTAGGRAWIVRESAALTSSTVPLSMFNSVEVDSTALNAVSQIKQNEVANSTAVNNDPASSPASDPSAYSSPDSTDIGVDSTDSTTSTSISNSASSSSTASSSGSATTSSADKTDMLSNITGAANRVGSVLLASSGQSFSLKKGVVDISRATQAITVNVDIYDPQKTLAFIKCISPKGQQFVVGGTAGKTIDYVINAKTDPGHYGNGELVCQVITYPHGPIVSSTYSIIPSYSGTAPVPPKAPANYASPAWWRGNCDAANFASQTGLRTYSLSAATYRGVEACGPRPYADGAGPAVVHFFNGAWGEFDFQCTELSTRYMYVAFNIAPYGGDGGAIVWNYNGNVFKKVANGTPHLGPIAGDVMSMGSTSTGGHTAIVLDTNYNSAGNGYIDTLNQNYGFSGDNGGAVARFSISNWYVLDPVPVSGWLHR